MSDHLLFPATEPYNQGVLPVGEPHQLYWEQVGRPDGVPVLFLHGGPGSGCSERHRQLFDPTFYRAVLFDQRGAGRSQPLGELEHNTTPQLIADIECLRTYLGIERWLVMGGSWGSTLALAYAQAYPERVLGLLLRGVFLGRPQEVEFFLYGMRQFFPEAWQRFADEIPEDERGDLLTAYRARLDHPDPAIRRSACQAWAQYEGACVNLVPSAETEAEFAQDAKSYALARLEAHYMAHRLFLEQPLLDGVSRIADIPGVIVQGRHDVVCPPLTAWELARAWPKADLILVDDAGHSLWEPGILAASLAALERFKHVLA
jgi:proline iminopeptidase